MYSAVRRVAIKGTRLTALTTMRALLRYTCHSTVVFAMTQLKELRIIRHWQWIPITSPVCLSNNMPEWISWCWLARPI